MPLFGIIWIAIFVYCFCSGLKSKSKGRTTARSNRVGSSPYSSGSSSNVTGHLCEDASNHRDNGDYVGNSTARAAGHLCEDAENHQREELNAAEVLNDMQEGYISYSFQNASLNRAKNSHYTGQRISQEQYSKKLEELESLLKSGMISRDEFNEKKLEYSMWVER